MSFKLLPEWAIQDAIMLTWPHDETDWIKNITQVEPVYTALCAAINKEQNIVIVAHTSKLKDHITTLLVKKKIDLTNIKFVISPCNDTWARDHGPLICANQYGHLKFMDFTFNGWGNKFEAHLDNLINKNLFEDVISSHVNYQSCDFVLEGGAIEVNEENTLLTTSACLLNQNRNPELNKNEIEHTLRKELGVEHILWLEHGYLAGDDTDSHIDTLARFAPNNVITYVTCNDENDEHYVSLNKMAQQLKEFRTANNEAFTLIPLPWPSAKYNDSGERLPATYANYLICNNTILVPTYEDEQDQLALQQIQKAYPKHHIKGINCLAIIQQFGSLHCLTMQLPKGVLK